VAVTSQNSRVLPRAAAASPAGKVKPRKPKPPAARRGDAKIAWLLITPALIGFGAFYGLPLARGIYLSFTEFHVLTPPQVVIGTLLSLGIAAILHRMTRSALARGVILLPYLISNVIAALVWQWMLDPQLGIVNVLLKNVTGDTVQFFGSSAWAIPTLAAITIWKWMGYFAVLIFAGVQTIPPTIYEAGRVDGASEVQMFLRLTLPLLRPILVMVVVLSVINSFQVFDIVQVTTQGGPANASNVLQMYIYRKAFAEFDFGYAATMSLALLVLLAGITFTQMRLARANESDLS